jgi:Zn-dependent protease with chaperone function
VPNAFATGRSPKHAAVAVTEGLWRRLEPQEVEGVLAHELSHVANRDVLVMTLASFFAMLAALLTRVGLYGGMFAGGGRNRDGGAPAWLIIFVVSILTYVISFVLIRTISRYREYAADRGSALITGAPEQLMSALQKIASDIVRIPQRDLREVVSSSPRTRPSRSASPASPRSPRRWAGRFRSRGWDSATSCSGERSSRARTSTGSSRSRPPRSRSRPRSG